MRQSVATLAAVVIGLSSAPTALPCSRVLWVAGDGQVFVGRTQDWTERANSAFRVYPRGIERTGAVAVNPHKWTSRYGSLALYAPNVVWIDYSKLDFSEGTSEMELPVEKKIFSLNGDVTGQLEKAKPFVFGMNER
jgi:penicillin V acylase-like amidase (Ntn superfamily)